MKFLITFSLLFFAFVSNAETFSNTSSEAISMEVSHFDGPGKRTRKTNRINKRRKKKCKQFGRKIYAG